MEQETDQLPHSLSGNRQPDAVVKEESFTNDCNESRAVNHSAAVPEQPAQSTSLPDSLSITNVFASKPRIQQEPRMVDVKNITDKVEPTELQQIIEHQFNLEILMKHRELRLIEQELAKCQIALEQLRRCEIVPFPGSTGLSEAVSDGTGSSLKAQYGVTEPQNPAPWGVTDGPYTRHYSKWLLNDSRFDLMPEHQAQAPTDYFSANVEGRSTRNSGAGLGRSSKGRVSRDSVGNFSHALPNYPMQARGKGGPLVIKRLADNQFVKLICKNCQRGDFSSVQGFLNHCRIAHKVDYKSHEAAATDCGRVLEADEAHLIPQANPAPVTTTTRAPAPRAPAIATQPPPAGFVHPLNLQAIPRYTWKVQAAAARAVASASTGERQDKPRRRSSQAKQSSSSNAGSSATVQKLHSTPLVASSSNPYLSSQFAKRGLGGNLTHAANRASEKIDISPDFTDEDETSAGTPRKQSISNTNPGTSGMRFAHSATGSGPERPPSRKGHPAFMSRPRPAPLTSQPTCLPSSRSSINEILESPHDANLSPHAADSNPGLVSDHEDDDAASELDEAHSDRHASPDVDVPMSQLGAVRRRIGACGADAMDVDDVDVEVEDDGDGHHGVLIRPRGLAFQEFSQRAGGSGSQRPVSRFEEVAK